MKFRIFLIIPLISFGLFSFSNTSWADEASGATITNFDLSPKIAKPAGKVQLQLTLKVDIHLEGFNTKCGKDTNSFYWTIYRNETGMDAPELGANSKTITRTSATTTYDLSGPVTFNAALASGEVRKYYAQINCPSVAGQVSGLNKLTASKDVSITFSSSDKTWGCVADDGKYACSKANLENLSDTPSCSGKKAIEIPTNFCGQYENGGGYGATCGNPGQPACAPGVTTTFKFEVPNLIKGGPETILDLIKIVLDWLIKIAVPIAVIMIIYGGILFLVAGPRPELATKGRKIITYAAIGLAIIFIGGGFITLIQSIFEGDTTSPSGTVGTTGNSCKGPNCYGCTNTGFCKKVTNGQFTSPVCDNNCNPDGPTGEKGSLCSANRDCQSGFECRDTLCQSRSGNTQGELCLTSRNCVGGLMCDASPGNRVNMDGRELGKCVPSNTSGTGGSLGDPCQRDIQCLNGLKCNIICQRRDGNFNDEFCDKRARPSNCQSEACDTIGTSNIGACVTNPIK